MTLSVHLVVRPFLLVLLMLSGWLHTHKMQLQKQKTKQNKTKTKTKRKRSKIGLAWKLTFTVITMQLSHQMTPFGVNNSYRLWHLHI